MTKRRNLTVTIIFAIAVILLVYSLLTIWVGFNLALFSVEAVEYSSQYEQIQSAREAFYNSGNMYIRWLSNMSNDLIRVPLAIFIIASPALFILAVRTYNLNKRRKARK